VSRFRPFDSATGEAVVAPIERRAEIVGKQLKLYMETGSSLEHAAVVNKS
jgi:hypothetical protein